MKKLIIILILVLISQLSFSQACCVLDFKISGKVTSDKIKLDRIYLPSTTFLVGYDKFDSQTGFYYVELGSDLFSTKFRSHLSSDFCMNAELIIERVFKKVKKYPIRITEEKRDHAGEFKSYELEIPTEQIEFLINENEEIEIVLPEIKI
ncbi:hypothetical protein [Winogradskyella sp. MH6]|jgi:hypothetical protein|uniref:hypothetical protein n=1 Tax=Winogradskyella sp. MH6 TaxID=2929510 RepID=UPI001FB1E809|nr:hypothetical protein [Winogradskyella sp. MH6]